MTALVFHGPGEKSWHDVPDLQIVDDTDAITGVDAVTRCGTDAFARAAGTAALKVVVHRQ